MIQFRQQGPIARITLNRPEKRNALNDAVLDGLWDAIERSSADNQVRVVLIDGAGQDFCAGMDIALLNQGATAGVMEHLAAAQKFAKILLAMRKHPRPIVAAVQGRALAGGAGIAAACDIVLAAESAQFGYPEVKIGFIPAIVMALLSSSVGEKRAFELMALGDSFPAARALELGLINHVFPDAEFEPAVESLVETLASRAPGAVSLTKRLLYQTNGLSLEAAIEAGIQANALSRMTEDAKQGFERFTKKVP